MSESETYFYQNFNKSFGTYDVTDEEVHTSFMVEKPHHALSETQYFGFSVPDENIHAFLYLWYHPNLNVLAAGPMIVKGVKAIAQACELFDYRNYFPAAQITPRLSNFTLDSSYSIEMLKPGKVFRAKYSDPDRGNGFDVTFTAVSDVLMWPSNKHFEQVMRTTGEVSLRGKTYRVDGHNVRDRSWGELRIENPVAGSPIVWTTGVFDDDFAFNVTGFDDPCRDPFWKDRLAPPAGTAHKFGWIIIDGQPMVVQDARSVTRYDPVTFMPTGIDLDVDVAGRTWQISGTVMAGAPISPWMNNRAPICLTRWECDGRIGWGDLQQVQGNDFLQLLGG